MMPAAHAQAEIYPNKPIQAQLFSFAQASEKRSRVHCNVPGRLVAIV